MTAALRLWRIEVRVPRDAVASIEQSLGPGCLAVSTFEDAAPDQWRVEVLAESEPDREALKRAVSSAIGNPDWTGPLTVEPLAPRDWLDESRRSFPPIRVGRYYIHGSHTTVPPASAHAIRLNAGLAFGTGEHASTRGCLLAIDRLARERRFRRPLDMGCGAGILAIAMAMTWRMPVVAADIDPVAVKITRKNARLNRVAALVRVAPAGPGYRPPPVAAGRPYDLIVANILAGTLCRLAGDLDQHLGPDGVAVLSGLLDRDARWVTAAHRAFGLRLVNARAYDGWTTLVVRR